MTRLFCHGGEVSPPSRKFRAVTVTARNSPGLGRYRSGVRHHQVALVGDLAAPQRRSGRWRTSTRAARLPHDLGAAAAVSPAPVDQSPSTSTSRPPGRSAATHRPHHGDRVGQRPQHVPAEHDVDGCRGQPGVGRVTLAHGHQLAHGRGRRHPPSPWRAAPWRARSRARRRRTPARRAAAPGCRCRSRGRPPGRRRRQHPEQQVTPGGAHLGVEQPVVGRLVERRAPRRSRGRRRRRSSVDPTVHSSSSWASTSSGMSPLAKTSCTSSESSSASMTRIIFLAPSRSSGTCRVGTHDASAES